MQASLCPFCMKSAETEICPHCGRDTRYTGHSHYLPLGYTLQGRNTYLLGAAIGQGGFGITYIALNLQDNQRVAIKEYFPTHCCARENIVSVSSYPEQESTFCNGKAHFIDEAQMLQSLSDLGSVVKVLDYFEANNSAYLVMEYLDGLSLKDHVEKNGKLPAPQFLNQMKPLMADMEKMHSRGVVHRDIAPDNIILLPDGRLKLIDFGAARSYVGDKSMTVVVKKGFAPVEQYMRKGSNASTDVYALAATIYYCITGIVPPDSAERQYGEAELLAPTSLGVELSREQEQALEKALEIQPKERTQSVAELAKALTQTPNAIPPKPEKAKPVPKKAKVQKPQPVTAPKAEPKKKAKWWIPVAAAAVLCIGAGLLFTGKDTPSAADEPAKIEAVQTELHPTAQLSAEARAYNEAVDLFKNGEYGKAAIAFGKLGDYRDAKEISRKIWDAIADRKTIAAGYGYTMAVLEDGTVAACGNYAPDVSRLANVVALAVGDYKEYALLADGTVINIDSNERFALNNIVAIEYVNLSSNYSDASLCALDAEGHVYLLTGSYSNEKLNQLQDVVNIDNGDFILLADGTVLTDFEISKQQDIAAACKTRDGIARLKHDGTVEFVPEDFGYFHNPELAEKMKSDVDSWEDIISICGDGGEAVLGIKADGTVVATGENGGDSPLDVGKWTDIVAVTASNSHSVGLKSDGTLITAGSSSHRARQTNGIDNIRLPADRDALLAEIKLVHITSEEIPTEIPSSVSAEVMDYNKAVQHFQNGDYGKAAIAFGKLGDFRDAKQISRRIWDAIAVRNTISAGDTSAVAIKHDGTAIAAAYDQNGRLSEWNDIISVSTASNMDAVGLKSDGTVVLDHTDSYHPIDISDWHDIVSVSISGRHVVGLKADGTVVAAGWNEEKDGTHIGQCDVSDWNDIIAVEAGNGFTVALKADGTVIKTGYDIHNVYEITKWTDVVAVDAGLNHIVALKSDGTVVATGWDSEGECNVSDWTDIVAIEAGSYHTLGIKSDGTAVSAGHKGEKRYNVTDWKDITGIAVGWNILAGLQSDGTVVTAGRNQDMIKNWQDVKVPADRDELLAAIELDYITDEDAPVLPAPETQPQVTEPSPADRYESAVSAYEAGNYTDARDLFEELGNFEDSSKYLRLIRIRNAGGNIGVGAAVYDASLGLTDSDKADIDAAAEDFYFADTAEVLLCNSDVACYYLVGDWNGGNKCYIKFRMNNYGGTYEGIGSKLSTNYKDTFSIDEGTLRVDVQNTDALTLKLTLTAPDTMDVHTYEKGNNTYTLHR